MQQGPSCEVAEADSDWSGDWVIDPCSACLLDERGTPVGDCIPCCDSTSCDCIFGTVSISNVQPVVQDGFSFTQLQFLVSGTSSGQNTQIGNLTGYYNVTGQYQNTGITAVVNVSDVYDIIKQGDHIQFLNRARAGCNVNATRNPVPVSILKLVLLLAGVGLAAGVVIVFCCCNPCKKKKGAKTGSKEKLLDQQVNETSDHVVPEVAGTINYTGETQPIKS